jgi:hypothetical protein
MCVLNVDKIPRFFGTVEEVVAAGSSSWIGESVGAWPSGEGAGVMASDSKNEG